MSFRDDLLPVFEALRDLSRQFGIRTNQLTIRTVVWSGGRIGLGTAQNTDLVLPAKYPIRFVTAQEIDASGGEMEVGDILVDHITPQGASSVGYTPAMLAPDVTTDDTDIVYVIVGEHEGLYSLKRFITYRPFTYQLVLTRRARPGH